MTCYKATNLRVQIEDSANDLPKVPTKGYRRTQNYSRAGRSYRPYLLSVEPKGGEPGNYASPCVWLLAGVDT
jgi:hypothetical protein